MRTMFLGLIAILCCTFALLSHAGAQELTELTVLSLNEPQLSLASANSTPTLLESSLEWKPEALALKVPRTRVKRLFQVHKTTHGPLVVIHDTFALPEEEIGPSVWHIDLLVPLEHSSLAQGLLPDPVLFQLLRLDFP